MTDTKKFAALDRGRFHLAEHYQQNYVAVVPANTDPASLEDPAFFSNVAFMCRASGRIWVECEDGTWCAELYIRSTGPQYAMCRILHLHDMADVTLSPDQKQVTRTAGYRVEWAGRHTKWRVVRESDNAVVQKGMDSQGIADLWLVEHLKAVAR